MEHGLDIFDVKTAKEKEMRGAYAQNGKYCRGPHFA